MTSGSVWVLRHLLCAYCVPSNKNEQHSPHVSHGPKTHTRLSSFNLHSHPGRCAGVYALDRRGNRGTRSGVNYPKLGWSEWRRQGSYTTPLASRPRPLPTALHGLDQSISPDCKRPRLRQRETCHAFGSSLAAGTLSSSEALTQQDACSVPRPRRLLRTHAGAQPSGRNSLLP